MAVWSTTRGLKIMVNKVVKVSPRLGEFLGGVSQASRTDATNELWKYITSNNLQVFCDMAVWSTTRGLKIMVNKVVKVSPRLGEFLGGVRQASRTDATNELWKYIRSNNLQDPKNKKLICCEDKSKTLFDGKEIINLLEIPKLLNEHFKDKLYQSASMLVAFGFN